VPINDVKMPGRQLGLPLAAKLQRCFVERFAPEMLPRLSPPYWGTAFERAALVSSNWLRGSEFAQRGRVLCLVGRRPAKPAPKFARAVYLCTAIDVADTLTSLHWSVHCDFYLFDRTFRWFVAALEERIFQMDDQGEYKLLAFSELSAM
jgi:hypothetical protein